MNLQIETINTNKYLAASEVIDFHDADIQAIAQKLSEAATTDVDLAKTAYGFVRDTIPHSFDIHGQVVTCSASSVLKHGEGICFAKSHLLAALLRNVGIPAGFCYQKLVLDDADPTYLTLHGLNGIYLESMDQWIRVDARGNKEGVNAEFCLEAEVLAYPIQLNLGEVDYPIVYSQPNHKVVSALRNSNTVEELKHHLPTEL